jgi:hypothetical protein
MFDDFPNARGFMQRSVIHDDNISGTQFRTWNLFQLNIKVINICGIIEVKLGHDFSTKDPCNDCRPPMTDSFRSLSDDFDRYMIL